jgi:hypothetical protein
MKRVQPGNPVEMYLLNQLKNLLLKRTWRIQSGNWGKRGANKYLQRIIIPGKGEMKF